MNLIVNLVVNLGTGSQAWTWWPGPGLLDQVLGQVQVVDQPGPGQPQPQPAASSTKVRDKVHDKVYDKVHDKVHDGTFGEPALSTGGRICELVR